MEMVNSVLFLCVGVFGGLVSDNPDAGSKADQSQNGFGGCLHDLVLSGLKQILTFETWRAVKSIRPF